VARTSLGLSLSGGTGLVVARLPDGTWSPPSAVGLAGAGFGVQAGLEIADYIFAVNSPAALAHFLSGGSVALGASAGASMGSAGRGVFGGLSVDAARTAGPISAYARSRGAYAGVALEGYSLHLRERVNAQLYAREAGRTPGPGELLGGHVRTPAEAGEL
jgi:lipid-binding SYLF domain-containing protein